MITIYYQNELTFYDGGNDEIYYISDKTMIKIAKDYNKNIVKELMYYLTTKKFKFENDYSNLLNFYSIVLEYNIMTHKNILSMFYNDFEDIIKDIIFEESLIVELLTKYNNIKFVIDKFPEKFIELFDKEFFYKYHYNFDFELIELCIDKKINITNFIKPKDLNSCISRFGDKKLLSYIYDNKIKIPLYDYEMMINSNDTEYVELLFNLHKEKYIKLNLRKIIKKSADTNLLKLLEIMNNNHKQILFDCDINVFYRLVSLRKFEVCSKLLDILTENNIKLNLNLYSYRHNSSVICMIIKYHLNMNFKFEKIMNIMIYTIEVFNSYFEYYLFHNRPKEDFNSLLESTDFSIIFDIYQKIDLRYFNFDTIQLDNIAQNNMVINLFKDKQSKSITKVKSVKY